MKEIIVKFKDYEGYKAVRHCVSEYLREASQGSSMFLEIAVNEAVNNALKHGSKQSGDQFVTLRLRNLHGRFLFIRVKDQGSGFSVTRFLKEQSSKEQSMFDPTLWQDSGRGIKIMMQAVDYLNYNKKGNEVLMVKDLTKSNKCNCKVNGNKKNHVKQYYLQN